MKKELKFDPLHDPPNMRRYRYVLDQALVHMESDRGRATPKNVLQVRQLARVVYHEFIKEQQFVFLGPDDLGPNDPGFQMPPHIHFPDPPPLQPREERFMYKRRESASANLQFPAAPTT